MNWFTRFLKFSQQMTKEPNWEEESFADILKQAYELEYKISMLRQRPFNGLPKRRDNIIKRYESQLFVALNKLKGPLLNTLTTWLKYHNMDDPEEWAKARLVPHGYASLEAYESDMGTSIDYWPAAVSSLYYNLVNEQPERNMNYYDMFRSILAKHPEIINNMSSLQQLSQLATEEKRMLAIEEAEYDLEGFNMSYGTQFQSAEEVEAYISQLTPEQLSTAPLDIIRDYGMDFVLKTIEDNGLKQAFLEEIYAFIIFPRWLEKWESGNAGTISSEGNTLAATRSNIEAVAFELQKAEDIRSLVIAVNHALRITHQTGDMLDYLEEYGEVTNTGYLKSELTALTNGYYVEEWNKELRQLGVQI